MKDDDEDDVSGQDGKESKSNISGMSMKMTTWNLQYEKLLTQKKRTTSMNSRLLAIMLKIIKPTHYTCDIYQAVSQNYFSYKNS